MSQENVEVVRKLYEARGSEFYELLDPHVVFINYATAPEAKPYIGHEGVRAWAKGFWTTLGKVVRGQGFETRAEALEAAGLRE